MIVQITLATKNYKIPTKNYNIDHNILDSSTYKNTSIESQPNLNEQTPNHEKKINPQNKKFKLFCCCSKFCPKIKKLKQEKTESIEPVYNILTNETIKIESFSVFANSKGPFPSDEQSRKYCYDASNEQSDDEKFQQRFILKVRGVKRKDEDQVHFSENVEISQFTKNTSFAKITDHGGKTIFYDEINEEEFTYKTISELSLSKKLSVDVGNYEKHEKNFFAESKDLERKKHFRDDVSADQLTERYTQKSIVDVKVSRKSFVHVSNDKKHIDEIMVGSKDVKDLKISDKIMVDEIPTNRITQMKVPVNDNKKFTTYGLVTVEDPDFKKSSDFLEVYNFEEKYTNKSFPELKLSTKSLSCTEIKVHVSNDEYFADSEQSDGELFSKSKNILHYFCLQENPTYCEKCKELKTIFENKGPQSPPFLFNVPIHHFIVDFQPQSTMSALKVILDEPQNKKIFTTMEENVFTRKFTYDLREQYTKYILKKIKTLYPCESHIFFSLFKTQFLEKKLTFFFENNIISLESHNVIDAYVGDEEIGGVTFINRNDNCFANIFLFGGLVNEIHLEKEKYAKKKKLKNLLKCKKK